MCTSVRRVFSFTCIVIREWEKLTGCLTPVLKNWITFIFSRIITIFFKNVKLDLLAPIFTRDQREKNVETTNWQKSELYIF